MDGNDELTSSRTPAARIQFERIELLADHRSVIGDE
jgi:hypothetical protein